MLVEWVLAPPAQVQGCQSSGFWASTKGVLHYFSETLQRWCKYNLEFAHCLCLPWGKSTGHLPSPPQVISLWLSHHPKVTGKGSLPFCTLLQATNWELPPAEGPAGSEGPKRPCVRALTLNCSYLEPPLLFYLIFSWILSALEYILPFSFIR